MRTRKTCYIATGLANAAQHNRLRDVLAANGWTITYDWSTHGAVAHLGQERWEEVAVNEATGATEADFVVVLLPGGRGTHVELGLALAAGKVVYLFAETEEQLLLEEKTCIFYYHPLVRRVCGDLLDLTREILAGENAR